MMDGDEVPTGWGLVGDDEASSREHRDPHQFFSSIPHRHGHWRL